MRNSLIAIFFMVLALSGLCLADNTTTLSFSECRMFYAPYDSNGTVLYTPIMVCGPKFPTIDQSITLDKTKPLQVFPIYNLSVQVNPEVYSIALDVQSALSQVQGNYSVMQSNITGIRDYVNSNQKETKDALAALNERLNGVSGQAFTMDKPEIEALTGRISAIENSSRFKDDGINWTYIILIGSAMLVGLFLYFDKKGSFNSMKYTNPGKGGFVSAKSHNVRPPVAQETVPDKSPEDTEENEEPAWVSPKKSKGKK
jgi:hypothetical protein